MLRLTLEREKRGWNKYQAAAKVGLHPSVYGQLENQRIFPYPAYQKKLENVFKIPAKKLFEEVHDHATASGS